MSRNTNYISIKGWKRGKWLSLRNKFIGASEIATVLATKSPKIAENIWSNPVTLYLKKIGEPMKDWEGNEHTEMGHDMEPLIARYYTHWDHNNPDTMTMHRNKKAHKILNRIRNYKVIVTNKKYPHLIGTPDRFILNKDGILECKKTTSFEKQRYDHGLNPQFVLQVQGYLMLTEKKFADVAILQTDRDILEVIRYYPDPELFKKIDEITREFWINIVLAKQIKKDHQLKQYFQVHEGFLTKKQQEGAAKLHALEPDFIGVDSELETIEAMIRQAPSDVVGNVNRVQREMAYTYIQHKNNEKKENAMAKKIKVEIIDSLNGVTVAEDEDGRRISYKATVSGSMRLHVSPKYGEETTEDLIEKIKK